MLKFWKSILYAYEGLLNLFYPHTCIGCGIGLDDRHIPVCGNCEALLPRTEHAWKRGNRVEEMLADAPLTHSIVRGAAFGYYEYGAVYRDMIHTFKYRNYPLVGEYLGKLAAKEFAEHNFFEGIDLLVPVPLHPKKLGERSYNQAELICNGLSLVTHIPIDKKHLQRKVNNASQTRKTAQERKANTADVFTMKTPADWKGKHILLVDDVITTGATLRACMQAMKGIYGLRVSVFTLGIARPPVIIEE